MRIAVLMELAPRKLGSFEGWLLELSRAARERGHHIDLYGRAPLHPVLARSFADLGVGWELADTLERAPVHAVRRLRRYDTLHLDLVAPRSRLAALCYAAAPAKVLFVDRSGGLPPSEEPKDGVLRGSLRKAADRLTAARIASMAGVSDDVRKRDRRRFGLEEPRLHTLYNGIDVRRFRPRPRPARKSIEIASVAHLVPLKGIDVLLRALALVRRGDVGLTVVGDGPEYERLSALARSLGVGSRVRFLGLRDDTHVLLAAADLFCHPTLAEAFGLVIAEAMASGLPVVASRVGGIPEVVSEGETGLLVPPGDAGALAGAIDRLVDSPRLRRRLGAAARKRAVERFDVRTCAAAHLDWCEQVAGSENR